MTTIEFPLSADLIKSLTYDQLEDRICEIYYLLEETSDTDLLAELKTLQSEVHSRQDHYNNIK